MDSLLGTGDASKLRRFARRIPLARRAVSLGRKLLGPAWNVARRRALAAVETAPPGTVFRCRINGSTVKASREMLRLWPHCWQPDWRHRFSYQVEAPQSRWLCSRLRPGDCALDVGAAFGVISLAMSRAVGSSGMVHAFEPARTTRGHLQHVLKLNGVDNIVVAAEACTDRIGTAPFTEYTSDNELSWASDASTLTEGRKPSLPGYAHYQVATTTIDEYVAAHELRPRAIKMDIEGVELYALRGARRTLARHRPALCVDLHVDARTGEPAEPPVRELLEGLGYDTHVEGHMLIATAGDESSTTVRREDRVNAVEARTETMTKADREKQRVLEAIEAAGPGTVFECKINGDVVKAPYEMIRLWPHCLHPEPGFERNYLVETQQSEWLCSRLSAGDCALDIGAAFGLITLTMANQVGDRGVVHAFEPARATREHLRTYLQVNGLNNVVVTDVAVSDAVGTSQFIEYTSENELSWASDASTLAEGRPPALAKYAAYDVTTTTLDKYVFAGELAPRAIKMDIEGVEVYALQGGLETLQTHRPVLCIDVHDDTRTGQPAEPVVRAMLRDLGYRCETHGHAIYAEPG